MRDFNPENFPHMYTVAVKARLRMGHYVLFAIITVYSCSCVAAVSVSEFGQRQCEPIRIEMCRNIGYNETSMPNLAGNEVQTEAEYTLQSFSPLIEYVCSSQLKLFLCATYVPMCTPKANVPIGPCRSLCESVRSRCDPVLQGFGYLWPPALDCNLFPKENNQESMCMEGPGEALQSELEGDTYPGLPAVKVPPLQTILTTRTTLECPGHSKLYVKLHRAWRCAPLCEASILFGPDEKNIAEIWTNTWTYAALGLSLLAITCLIIADTESTKKCESTTTVWFLSPLMWCHIMVVIGWTVRFVAGRTKSSCGYDPQLPNVSLLLVDGLSNGTCAATFILRYYFGMAACAWWAILCLGWHRDVRRNSPDLIDHITVGSNAYPNTTVSSSTIKHCRGNFNRTDSIITTSNLARFLAWGLPAFQTAAVIVARLVDADELIGACFVGNQSEKGLQILVATPLFCYWIFGSMNLASGFLVHRRNKEILGSTNLASLRIMLQSKFSISGLFLFIYCLPCAVLLLAVIYEFANIDVWLNISPYIVSVKSTAPIGNGTPMWPFLTRAFMELLLTIICSAWILVPQISSLYKSQMAKPVNKAKQVASTPSLSAHPLGGTNNTNCRSSNKAYSTVSYQSVRQPKNVKQSNIKTSNHQNSAIVLKHHPIYSFRRNKIPQKHSSRIYVNAMNKNVGNSFHCYGDETIL